jgi:hypothetical protein
MDAVLAFIQSFGGPGRSSNRLTHELGGDDPRFHDLPAVPLVVPAVDAPAGQVDNHIRTIHLVAPIAKVESVPLDCRPGRRLHVARHDTNRIALSVKVTSQDLSDLAAATGDDDVLRSRLSFANEHHFLRVEA